MSRTQHHPSDIPAKDAEPESNYGERSDKLKHFTEGLIWNFKVERTLKNCPRLKETTMTENLIAKLILNQIFPL